MSCKIIEVQSCPGFAEFHQDKSIAIKQIQSNYEQIISYLYSVGTIEQTVFEIAFISGCDKVRMFFVIRQIDQSNCKNDIQTICSSVIDEFNMRHYTTQILEGTAFQNVVLQMRTALHGSLSAVVKGEKMSASGMSYAGYYYFTDILITEKTDKTNNYNSLLSRLLKCPDTVVGLQLIPVQMTSAENYAVTSLASELQNLILGVPQMGQMYRDVSAELPHKTYDYYAKRNTQPLFVYNAYAASAAADTCTIAGTLKNCISSSTDRPVTLEVVNLNGETFADDYFHFPWILVNLLMQQYRDMRIWNGTMYQPSNLYRLPYLVTAEEASCFFKFPIDDGNAEGIEKTQIHNDNEILNDHVIDSENIVFGRLVDKMSMIGVDAAAFTRHALIVGMPGSGKTTFALNLLLQFYEKGIPFLAIEPTKTEYRALIDQIPDLQVFTPGKSSVSPFVFNPFLPPKGIELEQYIPSLMSAFRAAFAMESPLDVIFLRAVRKAYARYGWKDHSMRDDPDVQAFGMYEFILEFKQIVSTSSYKAETKANIETGGTFRLMNLIDQNKNIYDTVQAVPIEALLEKPTILELNAIADDEQKSLLMALLLVNVCLYVKSKGSSAGDIKNVFLIDEAHVLLDSSGRTGDEQNKAQMSTVKSLQKMIAEIRAFGMGVIIADQKPSKVTLDVVADTDIKVVFRLVEANERSIIANSTNMTEQQSQYLARMKCGEAMTYFSELESVKAIITPDVRDECKVRYNVTDEEIKKRSCFWDEHSELLVPFYECNYCPQCKQLKKCDANVRSKADYYSSHIISTLGHNIGNIDTLIKYMYGLDKLVIRYEAEQGQGNSLKHICNCTKLQFLRKIMLEGKIHMDRKSMSELLKKTLIGEPENV